jgi:hypothetical protein
MAVITLMPGYVQLTQESVIAYANCLIANWTQAGWNPQKHKEVLNHIAWSGVSNSVMNQVGPKTPSSGRFDAVDEFFDRAAASDVTLVENMKPQQPRRWQ